MPAPGVVRGAITVPGPCVVRVSCFDAAGRLVSRQRSRDLTYSLTLAPGRYHIDVEDDRPLGDVRRHTATRTSVTVAPGTTTPQPLRLDPATTVSGFVEIQGWPARYARVQLRHEDDEVVDVRADGHGGFVAAGLRPGAVTVTAHDARRTWAGRPVSVGADRLPAVVRLDTPTAGLVIGVQHPDGEAVAPVVPVAAVVVNVDTHQRYLAEVRHGLCAVTGIAPGRYRIELEPSLGSLGGTFDIGSARSGPLRYVGVVVERGATITGRVVGSRSGRGELAAVVTLLDRDGSELERTRTDRVGRFLLGHGLDSSAELTVVVSTGPERHHLTQLALADVRVQAGRRRDLGTIAVAPTCIARWAPRLRAAVALRLPATPV